MRFGSKTFGAIDASRLRKVIYRRYNLVLGEEVRVGDSVGLFVGVQAYAPLQETEPYVKIQLDRLDGKPNSPKELDASIEYNGRKIHLRAEYLQRVTDAQLEANRRELDARRFRPSSDLV